MVNSAHTLASEGMRHSKCKVQLFYYGVHGKIQVLQIPEKCSKQSNEVGKGKLSRVYVLNPKSEPVEAKPIDTKPVGMCPEGIKPTGVE